LFESVGGYDTVLSYSENTELSFRLKQKVPKETFIAAYNLEYHVSDDGLSKNWVNRKNAMLYILNKHKDLFEQNRPLKKRYMIIAGVAAAYCKNRVESRDIFKLLLIEYPFSPGVFVRFLATYSPFVSRIIWKKI
jgi:hypothetical protein